MEAREPTNRESFRSGDAALIIGIAQRLADRGQDEPFDDKPPDLSRGPSLSAGTSPQQPLKRSRQSNLN